MSKPDGDIELSMSGVRQKIVVLSGKGGVGKSTIAVNLASALSLEGKKVGLLDIDFHGPTVPTMLNLTDKTVFQHVDHRILPVQTSWGLKTISLAYFLRKRDDALIWRGPMKAGVIRQLLQEVKWGELDYLVVDCPPGTGDEPLTIVQLLIEPKSAVVVTMPQEVSLAAVRRSITFCRSLGIPIQGIIENMSGYLCPYCRQTSESFSSGAVIDMAHRERIPVLGKIPFLPEISSSGDKGVPVALKEKSPAGEIFREMAQALLKDPERQTEGLEKDCLP